MTATMTPGPERIRVPLAGDDLRQVYGHGPLVFHRSALHPWTGA
ncbi:hypothetical protein [Actinomycetospora sp. NBRC 106375]|nr:hypothetical protein [Actinomycetospora sp. NBRC 106375]